MYIPQYTPIPLLMRTRLQARDVFSAKIVWQAGRHVKNKQ